MKARSSRLTFGAQNQIRKAVLATVQFRVVEALDEAWPEIAGPRVLEHVPGYRRSHVERFGLEHLVACRRWQSVLLDEPLCRSSDRMSVARSAWILSFSPIRGGT